jgi:DNA-binding response OmpR family regulator
VPDKLINREAPRILVVDDEPYIRDLVREMLSMAGYEVEIAGNGNEAMVLFENGRFDLVLTDLMMPEKEGIETIQEMKLLAPELKIIAMSGRGGAGSFLNVARHLGADAILAKPFDNAKLLGTIREVLGEDFLQGGE